MNTKLQWLDHLEEMKEIAWYRTYRKFKVSGSFHKGRPGRMWNEAIRSNLKEYKKEMLGRFFIIISPI